MSTVVIPEGYKIKFVKIGVDTQLTDEQKQAMRSYYFKNREKINERNKIQNKLRYDTDPEYKLKTQERMRAYQKKKALKLV